MLIARSGYIRRTRARWVSHDYMLHVFQHVWELLAFDVSSQFDPKVAASVQVDTSRVVTCVGRCVRYPSFGKLINEAESVLERTFRHTDGPA